MNTTLFLTGQCDEKTKNSNEESHKNNTVQPQKSDIAFLTTLEICSIGGAPEVLNEMPPM